MLENERTKRLSTLFDSYTAPIPPVRRDVQIIPVEDPGRELLLFFDSMKYVKPGFALNRSVEPALSLLDGRRSLNEIKPFFGNGTEEKQILEFIQMLDEQLLLESSYFYDETEKVEQQFETLTVREPALAGSSYPETPAELAAFVDNILTDAQSKETPIDGTATKALYAPHIDLRVGDNEYGQAFSTLKELKPRRIVILATSHYSGYYPKMYNGTPFIGSEKSYKLPGRILHPDREALNLLSENGKASGFTTHDRAHRVEHSIETHLLFASQIWKHNFNIVPILVGSLDELFYKQNGDSGNKLNLFTQQLRELDSDNTFFLISGDLSHVGQKFGDSDPARLMRPDVEAFDLEFINSAVENNSDRMFQHVARKYDPYRICGFPPLYTFLKAFPELKGQRINYQWWDESERESAVSFGSIAYSD